MIGRKLLVALAMVLASVTNVGAEDFRAIQYREYSSGNWSGGGYRRVDGSFSHCDITTVESGDIGLLIALTWSYRLMFLMANPDWKFTAGAEHDVGISVDLQSFGNFSGSVTNVGNLLVVIDNRDDIFRRLRSGRTLYFQVARRSYRLSLTGSDRALGLVRECVDLAVGSPGMENPFAPAGNQTNPFASDE